MRVDTDPVDTCGSFPADAQAPVRREISYNTKNGHQPPPEGSPLLISISGNNAGGRVEFAVSTIKAAKSGKGQCLPIFWGKPQKSGVTVPPSAFSEDASACVVSPNLKNNTTDDKQCAWAQHLKMTFLEERELLGRIN